MNKALFYHIGFIAILAGCTPYVGPPSAPWELTRGTITHRVARGETIWRIAKHYGVGLEEIVRINRISDASQIEVGQVLHIPTHSSLAARPSEFSPQGEEFLWPVEGRVIAFFGMRRGGMVHRGIDIQAKLGSEVRASKSGVVSFVSESMPGYGKTIILDHHDGFATVYAHVGEILVQRGERISQAQAIATVGDTGRTEVPALHFQIRRYQKPQNPFYYLP